MSESNGTIPSVARWQARIDRDKRIVEMRRAGKRFEEIAAEVGIGSAQVHNICRENSIPNPPRKVVAKKAKAGYSGGFAKLPPVLPAVIVERNADIKRRVEAGETLQSIGDDYKLTRERVRQICGARNATEIRAERAEKIVGFLNKGGTPVAACKRFGVSRSVITDAAARFGVRLAPTVTGKTLHVAALLLTTSLPNFEIHKKTGVGIYVVGSVKQRLRELGFKCNGMDGRTLRYKKVKP